MCLILFAFRVHPDYPLIVAANRDEDYKRETAVAHFWEDSPRILAGRDLEKMGTWMGVNTAGRFAALTNFRDPKATTTDKRSRGELVANALKYDGSIEDYVQSLKAFNHLYAGYNLLTGDRDELFYYSNISGSILKLESGIYGVSNHLLDTAWPKVKTGKEGMRKIIKEQSDDMAGALFTLLQNSEPVPDRFLPNTGVSLEEERMLSPLFVESESYGTRSSTVMLMSDQSIEFIERVHSWGKAKEQTYKIALA